MKYFFIIALTIFFSGKNVICQDAITCGTISQANDSNCQNCLKTKDELACDDCGSDCMNCCDSNGVFNACINAMNTEGSPCYGALDTICCQSYEASVNSNCYNDCVDMPAINNYLNPPSTTTSATTSALDLTVKLPDADTQTESVTKTQPIESKFEFIQRIKNYQYANYPKYLRAKHQMKLKMQNKRLKKHKNIADLSF
jgi:hypothetical protein